ncbi:MAG: hypothetical protein AAB875_07835, partial [Patescibacteria group bacterium]
FVSVGTTALLAFGILLIYYLFPDIAIKLLYGREYLAARASLIWMGLFMTFYSIAYLIVNFFLSIGRTKIAYLPLLFSLLQVGIIWFYLPSIKSVVQISLSLMVLLCLALVPFLGYNRLRSYEKR